MKIRPPWSRRRCTQPATRTPLAHVARAQLAGPARCGSGWLAARLTAPAPLHQRAAPRRRPPPRVCSPRGHVLDLDAASPTITVDARADPVGLLQLTLQRAAGLLELHAQAASRSSPRERERRRARVGARPAPRTRRRACRLSASPSAASRIRSTPAAKPTPGSAGPAELLDQAVVAAAAAERVLRAERAGSELEHRARVVVEPAHERRVDLVAEARVVEQRPHRREVLGVLGGEPVEQPRAPAITARVPGWSASNARSGLASSRSRTSSESSASCARR